MSKRMPVDDYAAKLAKFKRDEVAEAHRIAKAKDAVIRAARVVAADTVGNEQAVEHLCALDRALDRLDKLTKGTP